MPTSRFAHPVHAFIALCAVTIAAGCGGGGGDGGGAPPAGSGAPGGTANAPPSIEGRPGSTIAPAQAYSFQPSATDPDSSTLTFTGANLPSWMQIDPASGRLTGRPATADIGTYAGITITVSDGRSSATLGPFTLTVTDAGTGSATLSWMPPTQNSDGTPLTNLQGYEIRYGLSRDEMSSVVSIDNPSLSIYMVENLTSGTWYFAVSAVNSIGVISPLSNVASKTIS
jgi:hypothetical protein